MQFVDARPAEFARAHALHGGLVAGAPGQRQGVGIDPRVQRRVQRALSDGDVPGGVDELGELRVGHLGGVHPIAMHTHRVRGVGPP